MASKVKAKKVKKPVPRKGRTSTSRVSTKNQVTIPVDILRNAGFLQGDEVEFEVDRDGSIQLKKVAPYNLFQALADAAGDTYKGFDLAKERAESWD